MQDRDPNVFALLDAEQLGSAMRASIGAVGDPASVLSAQVAEKIRGLVFAEDGPLDRLAVAHRLKGTIAGYLSASAGNDGALPYLAGRVLRRVLFALIRLGDIAAIDRRRFLPTPARLVNVHGSEFALVVGSEPIIELEGLFDAKVISAGVARVVRRGELSRSIRSNEDVWQSFGEWLGNKEHRPNEWSRFKLVGLSKQLRLGMLPDAENVAVLAAIEGRSTWQRLEAIQSLPRGFALARFNHIGTRRTEYCICVVGKMNEACVIERSAPVPGRDGERLAFSLARLNGSPLRVTIAVDADRIHVDCPVRLPAPENKVLMLAEWAHRRVSGESRIYHRSLLDLIRNAYHLCGAEVTVMEKAA